ncbi:MAG: hypothetical protein ACRCXT_19725 [Paraclostridium sp.]
MFKFSIVDFFMEVLRQVMNISTDICLISGLIGAILYICGLKKAKSVPILAFVIDLIIKILGGILLGI